jgi:hypothetical protein
VLGLNYFPALWTELAPNGCDDETVTFFQVVGLVLACMLTVSAHVILPDDSE